MLAPNCPTSKRSPTTTRGLYSPFRIATDPRTLLESDERREVEGDLGSSSCSAAAHRRWDQLGRQRPDFGLLHRADGHSAGCPGLSFSGSPCHSTTTHECDGGRGDIGDRSWRVSVLDRLQRSPAG